MNLYQAQTSTRTFIYWAESYAHAVGHAVIMESQRNEPQEILSVREADTPQAGVLLYFEKLIYKKPQPKSFNVARPGPNE